MKGLRLVMLVSCLYLAAPATATASLIGDSVACTITGPFVCSSASAVVGTGAEFRLIFLPGVFDKPAFENRSGRVLPDLEIFGHSLPQFW